MNKMHSLLGFLAFLIVLGACNAPENKKKKQALPLPKPATEVLSPSDTVVEADPYTLDFARFLAGVTPLQSSTIPKSFMDSTWKAYSERFDKRWAELEQKKFKTVSAFGNDNFSSLKSEDVFLFYPFSGPDFLNATLLFPGYKRSVLLALEPAGFLPDASKFDKDSVPEYLQSIETALQSILKFSFFRTLSMEKDFRKDEELNGAVHLLCFFIVRTGHDVLRIEQVFADDKGNLTNGHPGSCPDAGIRIWYRKQGQRASREVVYFPIDLSDRGLMRRTCFQQYLEQAGKRITYLKSASYLMHKDYFSRIRTIILQNSLAVIQDDSGIPVRYFPDSTWKRQLYGSYDAPIQLFANWFQKDLQMLYDSIDKAVVKPLNFGIGYDYKNNGSNLMFFSKK